MRCASKSSSPATRRRSPLLKKTSPSATPVYGLSDQTTTVERSTDERLKSSATKRLYSTSEVNEERIIFNMQVARGAYQRYCVAQFLNGRSVSAFSASHKCLSSG